MTRTGLNSKNNSPIPYNASQGERPKVLFLHQGAELYGSDFIFYEVVAAMSTIVEPIVVLDSEGPLVEKLAAVCSRVTVHPLGVLRRKYLNVGGALTCLRLMQGAVRWLYRLIREERVDLVYSNTIGVWPGALAAKLSRVPHLYHVHEIVVDPAALGRIMAWFVLAFSDRAICVSVSVAEYLHRGLSRRRRKIRVIHNGLDTVSFDQAETNGVRQALGVDEQAVLIAMVGRVHHWKGQDYIIEAARILKSDGMSNFRVAIVGDVFPGYESLREELKRRVVSYGLDEQVQFYGFRNDVPGILKVSDIVVLPSTLPDPLPTVVLEGMAARKPVVATAQGGALEMVKDGETGFHVPLDDPAGLAHRLLQLAADPRLREKMGRAGRARLESLFTKARFQREIIAVVTDLLGLDSEAIIADGLPDEPSV